MRRDEVFCHYCGSAFVEPHGDRRIQLEFKGPEVHQSNWWCCWCGKITHTEFIPEEGGSEDDGELRFHTGRFAGMTAAAVLEEENGRRYLDAMARNSPKLRKFLAAIDAS